MYPSYAGVGSPRWGWQISKMAKEDYVDISIRSVTELINEELLRKALQAAYDSGHCSDPWLKNMAENLRDACFDEIARRLTVAEGLEANLIALTPGGSEYHGDPGRCLEWIHDRLASTGKIAKERNELRARLAAAEALAEALRDITNTSMGYTRPGILIPGMIEIAQTALAAWEDTKPKGDI